MGVDHGYNIRGILDWSSQYASSTTEDRSSKRRDVGNETAIKQGSAEHQSDGVFDQSAGVSEGTTAPIAPTLEGLEHCSSPPFPVCLLVSRNGNNLMVSGPRMLPHGYPRLPDIPITIEACWKMKSPCEHKGVRGPPCLTLHLPEPPRTPEGATPLFARSRCGGDSGVAGMSTWPHSVFGQVKKDVLKHDKLWFSPSCEQSILTPSQHFQAPCHHSFPSCLSSPGLSTTLPMPRPVSMACKDGTTGPLVFGTLVVGGTELIV